MVAALLAQALAVAGGGSAWAWWSAAGIAQAPDEVSSGVVDVQVVGLGDDDPGPAGPPRCV